jgi:hypothetical protein
MATVVVVQSDDLAAWIGVAGVAVGVLLTAGIDGWRNRKVESKRRRVALIHAGFELAARVQDLCGVVNAVGDAHREGKDQPRGYVD